MKFYHLVFLALVATTIVDAQDTEFRLQATTGNADYSQATLEVKVEFYVNNEWSDPFTFFSSTLQEHIEQATYNLDGVPSSLRFYQVDTGDAWGVGQVVAWVDDGSPMVLLCTEDGTTPEMGENGHWVGQINDENNVLFTPILTLTVEGSFYDDTCDGSNVAWVGTVEEIIIASTIVDEAEVLSQAVFLASVQNIWDANANANCRSPWFIWEAIDTDTDVVYSDVRVCFDTEYDTWAAGHVGDLTGVTLANAAYWQVEIPSQTVSLAISGEMVRAVLPGDTHESNGYGLHYKRTDDGEHFPFWTDTDYTSVGNVYLCTSTDSCGYELPTMFQDDSFDHRITVLASEPTATNEDTTVAVVAEDTTVAAEDTTVAVVAEDTTVAAVDTTVVAEDTTVVAEDTTVAAEDTTVAAEDTTVAVVAEDTTVAAEDTTVAAEDTTVAAEDTTVAAEDTTVAAEDTTVAAEDTTVAVVAEDTTVAAEDTTVAAEDTTVAAEDTTVAAEDTTVAAEDTTVAAEDTTVAAEDTTVAAEDTTVVGGDAAAGNAATTAAAVNADTTTAAAGNVVLSVASNKYISSGAAVASLVALIVRAY